MSPMPTLLFIFSCHLVAHLEGAELGHAAWQAPAHLLVDDPELPKSFVNGTFLAMTNDPAVVVDNPAFNESFGKAISTFTKINMSRITLRTTCLTGCSVHDPVATVKLHSSDVRGVVLVMVNIDTTNLRDRDKQPDVVLRRFGGIGSQELQKIFEYHRATLNDTLFRTNEEIGYYKIDPFSPQRFLKLEVASTLNPLVDDKAAEEACYWAVLEEQLRTGDFWNVMTAASTTALRVGGTQVNAYACRRKAMVLLKATCEDRDRGLTDSWGSSCSFYSMSSKDACGKFDHGGFVAAKHCCACGGGDSANQTIVKEAKNISYQACADTVPGSAVDTWKLGCEEYNYNPNACGKRDSENFTARSYCCACGGGVINTYWRKQTEEEIAKELEDARAKAVLPAWVYLRLDLNMKQVDVNPNQVTGPLQGKNNSMIIKEVVENAASNFLKSYLGLAMVSSRYNFGKQQLLAVVAPTAQADVTSTYSKLVTIQDSSETFLTPFVKALVGTPLVMTQTIDVVHAFCGIHGSK